MYHCVNDWDNGWGYSCEATESIWGITVPSSQFCCEPETALKNQSLIKFTKRTTKKILKRMIKSSYKKNLQIKIVLQSEQSLSFSY